MKIRKVFWKTWNFLVHEDSIASFVADALLILIIGNFILFPGIGMALNTEFPVVAVISGSMDHHNINAEEWWVQNAQQYEKYNISQSDFDNFYAINGFDKGDVLVIKGIPMEDLKIGDVIVYSVPQRRDPIIHRIVSLDPISTKGDANHGQISFEKSISENQIHGKAVTLVPYIGWVKVGAMELFGLI
jgi:hypothetical protein